MSGRHKSNLMYKSFTKRVESNNLVRKTKF
nr:MAG TPA: hypothetical protein [Bacteriophage sp.]DAR64496.1 MAG TPA: hypothetical protein [Caudoviricetes sp.]DAW74863.1 MAG TPA: hypothetical protein [Ackermannviridae sp.]